MPKVNTLCPCQIPTHPSAASPPSPPTNWSVFKTSRCRRRQPSRIEIVSPFRFLRAKPWGRPILAHQSRRAGPPASTGQSRPHFLRPIPNRPASSHTAQRRKMGAGRPQKQRRCRYKRTAAKHSSRQSKIRLPENERSEFLCSKNEYSEFLRSKNKRASFAKTNTVNS